MKADALPVLALFERKMRLEVPLFQRQYVWTQEDQWEPLWEDISRKFTEFLEGRRDAPVHFLGAMVLDQKQTPVTHVERRQIIDGQQRLTTLQIFLSALRDYCREKGCEDLANEFQKYTANSGMMPDPEVDKFKVWPTKLDRVQFMQVVGLGSRAAIVEANPLIRRKWARTSDPRPPMVEAYLYFYDELRAFFEGTDDEPPLCAEVELAARIDEAFQALKSALQVVAIDLDGEDDAQVIFETLNARGAPLLPADLLRNYIFLRAARKNEPQEALYEKYWSAFDDEFWRAEVRQGRLLRPRSDLFMQHFLASRQCMDIPIKHLFVEYRHWIERGKPFGSVTEELEALSRQGRDFRRVLEPKKGDPIAPLASFMETFDVRTAYPMLLMMLDVRLPDSEWAAITRVLESYLVRRAVCGGTTKAYNRIFLGLTKSLREAGPSAAALSNALSSFTGESSVWPTDEDFLDAWLGMDAYQRLGPAKIPYMLKRLSDTYMTNQTESVTFDGPLTVEHLMPQKWIENWPLADGGKGMTWDEIGRADDDDPVAEASRKRHRAAHTLGNLTIVTQPLNSSLSHSSWAQKKPAILEKSVLPINQRLHSYGEWNEAAIERRARELYERAVTLWPRPSA